MGERRSKQGLLLTLCCVTAAGATAGRNGNFERTVGIELARLSAPVEDEPLPDSTLGARRHCDEFCQGDLRRSKRMDMPATEDNRLDRRLRSSYRQMGENLAARLWDDPDGRRIKFDIEGRPGIGLEIPFD